jgi:hypothetical protein
MFPATTDRVGGTGSGSGDADGGADYDVTMESTEVDSSSRTDFTPGQSARGRGQETGSEDMDDDNLNNTSNMEGNDAENEEVDSGSDESAAGDEGSDGESVVPVDTGAKYRSSEDGRLRMASLNFTAASPVGGGSGSLSLPGMSKVLVSSGRQTIMSGTSTADKISSMRAMGAPTLTSAGLRTLSPSGPGGSLSGRSVATTALLKNEIDCAFGFGDVSDGIASLQLNSSAGNVTSASA